MIFESLRQALTISKALSGRWYQGPGWNLPGMRNLYRPDLSPSCLLTWASLNYMGQFELYLAGWPMPSWIRLSRRLQHRRGRRSASRWRKERWVAGCMGQTGLAVTGLWASLPVPIALSGRESVMIC